VRYYRLEVTPAAGGSPTVYSSYNDDGTWNPRALQLRVDASVYQQATPIGNAWVQLWGIGLPTVAQQTNLQGASAKLYLGMGKGLPLSDPSQQGLAVQGTIWQAFGNWVGLEMTLDLIFRTDGGGTAAAAGGTADDPVNISLNWQKGQNMGDAVTLALSTAYPDLTVQTSVSPNLALPPTATAPLTGVYQKVQQFSKWCLDFSKSILPAPYNGVQVVLNGDTFYVTDGTQTSAPAPGQTTQSSPKAIRFSDMIGQPTWVDYDTVQVQCVMRADVSVGDYIQFPQALTTHTRAENAQQAQDSSAFQGTFQIQKVRFVGDSRAADATGWVTVIDAYGSAAPLPGLLGLDVQG